MCRYATKKYKAHYVCFDCRKGFKQSPIEDLVIENGDWKDYEKAYLIPIEIRKKFRKENSEIVDYLEQKYINRVCKCPDCGQAMKNVGLDFKSPKKEKTEEWKILESLYSTGKFFYSCGCDAYGFIPKDKNKYEEYLLETKEHFQQKLMQRQKSDLTDELIEYLTYWNEKISLIDNELKKVKI